jgi:ADP-ribose pyrophosphatase YjhB (NUDIX family)
MASSKFSDSDIREKDIRENIFGLFVHNHRLKFTEIEKNIRIRSNKLAYYMNQLIKEGLIEKKGFFYSLTNSGQKHLPSFSHKKDDEHSPIPIILVAAVNKQKILLLKRNNRPYQGYWGLIGGKMNLEENIYDSAKRILSAKTGLITNKFELNSILHERISENKKVKYSFILICLKTNIQKIPKSVKQTNEFGELKWFDSENIDEKSTIHSDYWLINNLKKKNNKIINATMEENDGVLSGFKLVDKK